MIVAEIQETRLSEFVNDSVDSQSPADAFYDFQLLFMQGIAVQYAVGSTREIPETWRYGAV